MILNVLKFSIFLLAFTFLLYRADKPFWGHHDWNNAYFGNIGRNYAREGIIATELGQVINSDRLIPGNVTYHTHHPPLLPLTIGISYFFFGVSELSTRLVPILFSIASLYFLYKLLELASTQKTALITLVLIVVTPMFQYFGKLAVHEILTLFFFILSLWRYLLWKNNSSAHNYIYLALSIFFGGLSGWPGHYIAGVINVYHYLSNRRLNPYILGLLAIPILTFTLQLVHNFFLTGSFFGGGLIENFYFRSTMIALPRFIGQEVTYLFVYITKPIIVISLVGIIISLRQKKNLVLLVSLFAFGIIHPVLFQEAAFRHDYLVYGLVLFFSTSAALALNWIVSKNKAVGIIVGLAVILLTFLQSRDFVKTLISGERYHEAVLIGKYIKSISAPGETVLLRIPQSVEFEGWHTAFYADREINVVRDNAELNINDEKRSDLYIEYLNGNFIWKRI